MKKKMFKSVLALLLILPGLTIYSQNAWLLKYQFEKGKSYDQHTRITQDIVQTMNGQEIKILSEIEANNRLDVENREGDGTALLLVSAGDLSVRSAAMGRDTTMKYSGLKDKVRVKLSETGKLISSEKVDSSEVSAIISQLNMGDQRYLPGKQVKAGEKWEDQSVVNRKPSAGSPFELEITTDTDYSFSGAEQLNGKELLKVTYTGEMHMKGKGTQMGMEMYLEGAGKTEGFFYFDPAAYVVVSSTDLAELEINVSVTGPQNMTIPMTQSVKTITTLEEKK